jgi:hypothetical protein
MENNKHLIEGEKIIEELKKLVLDVLKNNPQGLGNSEVAKRTGTDLEVPSNPQYISWTILKNLDIENKIENREGKYFLKDTEEERTEKMKKIQEITSSKNN